MADTTAGTVTGMVKWFDPSKGFGIIRYNDGANEIYVHSSAMINSRLKLEENQKVQFIIGNGDQGTHAQRVSILPS